MNEPNNSPFQIKLPLVLFIGLAVGVLIGSNINSRKASPGTGDDIQKLREVLGLIKEDYVDTTNTAPLVEEAINLMLEKLDPHSVYIPASEKVQANESLQGNFEGIGIEFNIFQDTLVVVAALPGGPSEAVGLRAGDRIVKVNDKNIASIKLNNRDVQKLLKGPKGTEVNIEVVRRTSRSPIQFRIIRDKIPQYSIDAAYMVGPDIGYIAIQTFAKTTHEEFRKAVKELRGQGMKKLILDLQNNGGGYMDQAIAIADDFLPAGQKIVYTDGQEKKYNQDAVATSDGDFEQGDLIVLVNENSASASEIVAGALQDNDRALLVGRRSFGKGLVQRPFELSDGSELRLTISRYYTPSGRSIQKPYDEYDSDWLNRFNHGELFTADSIKVKDSLRYKTTNGRVVYGGGGILPDYFVPLDTSEASSYFNRLFQANVLREFAFNYAEKNKATLEPKGFEWYSSSFVITDAMLTEVAEMGKRNQVEPDWKDLTKNKRRFQVFLKAEIASRVWGRPQFYPIYNETNEALQKAMTLFDRIPELAGSRM